MEGEAARRGPGYGRPNWDLLGRWLELDGADDGPFWALNLMRYKQEADYGHGGPTGVSGRAADDAYAPLGPLAAVGAMVALHADVAQQPLGDPTWHRVGIVRYPSRAAFFAMQQRDDFQQQHVHKEAGMDRTIVLACHPEASTTASETGSLVLTVERRVVEGDRRPPVGALPVAELAVEGVIVGDDRTWTRATFHRATDADGLDDLVRSAGEAEEAFVLVLEPGLDHLVDSITASTTTDPDTTGRQP
ncbi:MAG: hypothetical protein ACSLFP_12795 [Acidimicrobiales bacterium]